MEAEIVRKNPYDVFMTRALSKIHVGVLLNILTPGWNEMLFSDHTITEAY